MARPSLPTWLFRTAAPAPRWWIVAKTLVQIVVVWSFALGLLPWLAVTAEDQLGVPRAHGAGLDVAGSVLFLAGSTSGLWSAWLMATEGRGTPVPFDAASRLVVAGPYRLVRNPMAVSAVVQLIGISLVLGSAATALLAVAGGVVWHLGIRPSEERFLAERFGEDYARYADAVRCWVPTWPPYRP